jgi:hypothetical protein
VIFYGKIMIFTPVINGLTRLNGFRKSGSGSLMHSIGKSRGILSASDTSRSKREVVYTLIDFSERKCALDDFSSINPKERKFFYIYFQLIWKRLKWY